MAEERIRILFLIGSYGTGGKERQLAELIKGLPRDNFEIHLMIKGRGAHYLDEIIDKLDSFYSLERERFGPTALLDIIRHIKKIKPHIVHSWAERTSFYSVIAKLFIGQHYKLIDGSIRHAPQKPSVFCFEHIQRMILNQFSDSIVANSLAGLKSFKVPIHKGLCINNGFDLTRVNDVKDCNLIKKDLGIETNYVVGMVARFTPQKDWAIFIEAAFRVLETQRDVTFVAVGGGPNLPNIEKLVRPELKKNFIFTGKRSDVESIVNCFDLGVLATFTEGISNSIIEYMALKKAVVATIGGGTEELVLDGITGYLITPKDSAVLSVKILYLLDNKSLRLQMGEAGKDRIIKVFSMDLMVYRYINLYKRLHSRIYKKSG